MIHSMLAYLAITGAMMIMQEKTTNIPADEQGTAMSPGTEV